MHTLLLRWETELDTWSYDDAEVGVSGEDGGVWYEAELGGEVLRGWLCGHVFDYFATAPEVVYVKAESLG